MGGKMFVESMRRGKVHSAKRKPGGNVVAVLALNGAYWSSGKLCYETIAALFEQPDSPVACTGVALDYLRQRCRRVSEAQARVIHPALFKRLDTP